MKDHRQFRQALGSFPTGVAIITAKGLNGRKAGLTINSFSSVSLTPRLVLWSLDRNSSSFPICMEADYFAVHILAADQEHLAARFCTSGIDRFAGVDTMPGQGDLPLLGGCAAVFQCRTVHRYEGGDHVIFVGEVLDFTQSRCEPLAFHGGRYAAVIKRPDTAPDDADSAMGVDLMAFLLRRAYSQLAMPLRYPLQRYGLHDVHRTILSVMSMGQGRSVDQTSALVGLSGHQVQPEHYEELRAQQLIELKQEGSEIRLYFTPAGMALAIEQAAIGQQAEEEALSVFEPQEVIVLKRLLQKLIHKTREGLPDGFRKECFWRDNNIWGAPASKGIAAAASVDT
ncbi:flavin reductase family protein [Pusillimonas sp. SM2304]|uniref:flavin reductase family protein n=1 Tax=Pusillimonas sp. SM2304 TaxID=3073241 RepID=UPI0028764533|nr:flavin reductase family protein [Pusillimonas sp. SM2304]MDS1139906.1 flavin reductase family protein [Pusillimonas sp. SM2304]